MDVETARREIIQLETSVKRERDQAQYAIQMSHAETNRKHKSARVAESRRCEDNARQIQARIDELQRLIAENS